MPGAEKLGLTTVVESLVRDVYGQLFPNCFGDRDHSPSNGRIRRECDRDTNEVSKRFMHEGLPFLSVQLPKLAKALERALECGSFEPPTGFKTRRGSRIPELFGCVFDLLFTPDGLLREHCDAAPDAIRGIRQICYSLYKLDAEMPDPGPHIESFKRVDESLPTSLGQSEFVLEKRVMSRVFRMKAFVMSEVSPQHGPGAVADGYRAEEKWLATIFPLKPSEMFHPEDFFRVPTPYQDSDDEDVVRTWKFKDLPAKLVAVPKDSRGPRLICEEPMYTQYIQQGFKKLLYPYIEHHPLLGGHVNFTDQTVNQHLALESSLSRAKATLDLKEASDRLADVVVSRIFEDTPLSVFLQALRTDAVVLPTGEIFPIRKFAAMGSALTFPIQAMAFWSICVTSIAVELCRSSGQSFSGFDSAVVEAAKSVYVYGDDIVVPSQHFDAVVSRLEQSYLRVNVDKSFRQGFFRESCGVDAYKGVDVTPIRFRNQGPSRKRDIAEALSWSSYAFELYERGYHNTATLIYEHLESIYGVLPPVDDEVSYVGIHPKLFDRKRLRNVRWNRHLHRFETKVHYARGVQTPSRLDGSRRLLRNLLSPQQDPDVFVQRGKVVASKRWQPLDPLHVSFYRCMYDRPVV